MRRAMPRTYCIAALIAALGYGAPLSAQANARQACSAQQHRQFDFWVGDWEVVDSAGQVVGHNRITREMGGCVLREEWTSAAGGTGASFNIYDAATGQWHQTWVDTNGTLLMLDGGLQSDGVMVMVGERPAAGGTTVRHRITWTRQSPDRVRQLWQVSDDGGVSWRGLFDGTYRRIATPGQAERT